MHFGCCEVQHSVRVSVFNVEGTKQRQRERTERLADLVASVPSPAPLARPRSRERGDAGDGTDVRSQSAETTCNIRRDTAAIAEAWGPSSPGRVRKSKTKVSRTRYTSATTMSFIFTDFDLVVMLETDNTSNFGDWNLLREVLESEQRARQRMQGKGMRKHPQTSCQ